MPEMINPLRYPGAKRMLVDYVDELLCDNNLQGCCFLEPYAGSAAVGLELLQRGSIGTLVLCEKDVLIYSLWQSVFTQTEALCTRIQETPITIDTWRQLDPYRKVTDPRQDSVLDLGFAGLFFNRTNFSGILKANPIGGMDQRSQYKIDCRFNKSKLTAIIRRLAQYQDRVEVHYDDALAFMHNQNPRFLRETCFAYLDPPYYGKGSEIYRCFYAESDHTALSRYVSGVHHLDWIISYDDAPFIHALYGNSDLQCTPFFMDYTCAPGTRSRGRELLISNLRLPPFAIGKVAQF